MNFTHFRLHTEYSLKNSVVNLKDIIKKLKKDDQNSICISDENNISNSINFYKNCIKNKIKPIIGCNFNINYKKNFYDITLISKNYKGYINLSKIISKSTLYNNNFLDIEWLNSYLSKNLYLIINFNNYKFKKKIIEKLLKRIKKFCKNKIYIEIQREYKNKNFKKIINIANDFNLPIIPTNPIFFTNKKDFFAYKAKVSIFNKDLKKKTKKNNYFYKKNKILKNFKNIIHSIKNTEILSKKCNIFINLNKIKLPFFKIKNSKNIKKFFFYLVLKKFKKKYKNFKNYKLYKKRILNELYVIIKMNLCDYFLIVNDFISWSKKNGIQVGPGRGSSAGSLVSYILNITSLNPIKNNLIFERFLNLERISIPDFDIDFCQEDRDKVIKYIKKKYGIYNTSQIITFNRMTPKMSIKDIGKFLNFNYDFINEINKLINLNNNINILELLKNKYKSYSKSKKKKINKLIYLIKKLGGIIKNIGVHAGGIIISPNKIFYHTPLTIQKDNIISQHFKDNLEDLGITKFDFLGLITLTIIKKCLKNEKNIKIKNIDLKDILCYKNLKTANTVCVFQLEGDGIRNILKFSEPENFNNIIAIISLYRPGPIKFINEFCLRKLKKSKILYIDHKIKNILKETYGIIIYQEQIMEIAKCVANYSLTEADNLRRLISKKKPKEMLKEKKLFINRCLKNKLSKKKSILIYNLIKEFSNYGFNKSHAAAYALLSFYTLWLKTYHIENFMSANMSCFFNNTDKLKTIISDSKFNGIYILPFDINLSEIDFTYLKNSNNKKIRYGFKGILGLGLNIINSILKLRIRKKFKNFFNFYNRIDKKIVNYKSIETIICAGGFDSLNHNRSNLINKLNILSKINEKNEKFKLLKNIYFKKNFFWNFKNKIIEERNSFGFFLNNNIYNIYRNKINENTNLKNFNKGVIMKIKDKIINNNFVIDLIDEKNDEIEIRIDKEIFKKNINIIKKYNLLIFKKKKNLNKKIFIVDKIYNF